jgi:hypothetical protein
MQLVVEEGCESNLYGLVHVGVKEFTVGMMQTP